VSHPDVVGDLASVQIRADPPVQPQTVTHPRADLTHRLVGRDDLAVDAMGDDGGWGEDRVIAEDVPEAAGGGGPHACCSGLFLHC
jgi:hypothetical protein